MTLTKDQLSVILMWAGHTMTDADRQWTSQDKDTVEAVKKEIKARINEEING